MSTDRVQEFLDANAKLEREMKGVKMHVTENGDRLCMSFEIGDETNSLAVRSVVPWMMEWRARLQRMQPPEIQALTELESNLFKGWCEGLEKGFTTPAEIAAAESDYIRDKIEWFTLDPGAPDARGHLFAAYKRLRLWGHYDKPARNLITTALQRSQDNLAPFETEPIDAARVRVKLKNWKARNRARQD